MMQLTRVHNALGVYFISYGMFYLLVLVGIIPLPHPSGFTVPAILFAIQPGLIAFGVYTMLVGRKTKAAEHAG